MRNINVWHTVCVSHHHFLSLLLHHPYSPSCSRGSWRKLASLEGGHVKTDWASNWALKTSHAGHWDRWGVGSRSHGGGLLPHSVYFVTDMRLCFLATRAFVAVCRLSALRHMGPLCCTGFSFQWLLRLQPRTVGSELSHCNPQALERASFQ